MKRLARRLLRVLVRIYRPAAQRGMLIDGIWPVRATAQLASSGMSDATVAPVRIRPLRTRPLPVDGTMGPRAVARRTTIGAGHTRRPSPPSHPAEFLP